MEEKPDRTVSGQVGLSDLWRIRGFQGDRTVKGQANSCSCPAEDAVANGTCILVPGWMNISSFSNKCFRLFLFTDQAFCRQLVLNPPSNRHTHIVYRLSHGQTP